MTVIRGEAALAAFRAAFTGPAVLDELTRCGGRMMVALPMGVGKSHNLDAVVEVAVDTDRYDLVVALAPTRRLIEERRWVADPPAHRKVVVLQPRPRTLCGPDRDATWSQMERAGLGPLGRETVCGSCPHRRNCSWPDQYGSGLKGAAAVFGTQTHLQRAPDFVGQVARRAGAERVLVILDEVACLMASYRRKIARDDLQRFVEVLDKLPPADRNKHHCEWVYRCALLLTAPTSDLRSDDWQVPPLDPHWNLAVQRTGFAAHRERFRCIAHDLRAFGASPLESRERTLDGKLAYAALPRLSDDLLVYSGTAHPDLTQFRLGREITSPYSGHRFEHPKTVWYNIASRLGTRTYFPRNAGQVLDFFAGLVSQRLSEGKRVLLIAKKCFARDCARELMVRLRALGTTARIATNAVDPAKLRDARLVPLITYGAIGTNLYEGYDCVYCLTGYYVNEAVIDEVLQDLTDSGGRIPVRIRATGKPRRRIAEAARPADSLYDVAQLAAPALAQQEGDVVLQAVGRVRPFTKPREVVTFQMGPHPYGRYTREFDNLAEARAFFGVTKRRDAARAATSARVGAERAAGSTQKVAACKLGLSLSTVKRHWSASLVASPSPTEAP